MRHNITTCPKRKGKENLSPVASESSAIIPSSTSEQVRKRQHRTIRSLSHPLHLPHQQQQLIYLQKYYQTYTDKQRSQYLLSHSDQELFDNYRRIQQMGLQDTLSHDPTTSSIRFISLNN